MSWSSFYPNSHAAVPIFCIDKRLSTLALALAFLLSIPPTVAATDPDLEPGFPGQALRSGGNYKGGPGIHTLVGNIDADPQLEILFSSLGDGPVYAFKADGSVAPGWPVVDGRGVGYLGLGELSSSPGLEVIAGYWGGSITAYDGLGTPLAGWPRLADNYVSTPPSLVDINNDGLDEVFVGEEDSRLHGYRADASPLVGWPTAYGSGGNQTRFTPATADLDGDGSWEVITASGFSTGGVSISAYHTDGRLAAGFPILIPKGMAVTYVALGDVDGDGAQELITQAKHPEYPFNPRIEIYSATGVLERAFEVGADVSYGRAVALADLDGDTTPEIVFQSDSFIHAWRGDGNIFPGWPRVIGGTFSNAAPVVGDVDGDQKQDVVVITDDATSSTNAKLYVFDRTGNLHPRFPKHLPAGDSAVPAIADIDLDGRNEIIVTGAGWTGFADFYDSVWAFDLGGPDHGAIQWGQFGGGPRHHHRYKPLPVPPAPLADVSVEVSSAPDPVRVSQTLTYTVAIFNAGPSTATDVEMVNRYSPGEQPVTTSVPCLDIAGGLRCSLGDVAPGETRTVSLTMQVLDERTLRNRTLVVSDATDNWVVDNDVTLETQSIALPVADVYVEAIKSADPIKVGKTLRYTVTVGNKGPEMAQSIQVQQVLPDSFAFQSTTGPCVQTGSTLECWVGDLVPGATSSWSVEVIPSLGGGGVYTTQISASHVGEDPAPANDQVTESTTVKGGGSVGGGKPSRGGGSK